MAERAVSPFGGWSSPITSALLVDGAVSVGDVLADGDRLWWTEGRPTDGGRTALVSWSADGGAQDETPPGADVGTRVHTYGGGGWWVAGGVAYYSDRSDGSLNELRSGEPPRAIVADPSTGFADLQLSVDGSALLCIAEKRSAIEGAEPANSVVSIDIATGAVTTLASGADFYAAPRQSPDGASLAWIEWHHPDMPWDTTRLRVGDFPALLAGENEAGTIGVTGESLIQPTWSPDGALHVLSDRDGFWSIFRRRGGVLEPLVRPGAEIGTPAWVFGMQRYAFVNDGSIVFAVSEGGVERLCSASADGTILNSDLLSDHSAVSSVRAWHNGVVCVAAGFEREPEVIHLDLSTGIVHAARPARALDIDGYVSVPESITFPTAPVSGEPNPVAHGLYYPPRNAAASGPANALPPLIVMSHGGPTGMARSQFQLSVQFWTSRGFAVADVNYRGSTGYGRRYREALNGHWGIADAADCEAAARFLAERGSVDGERLIIRGRSAGGYTTLAALTFGDTFSAGASIFGIADLELLATETHKFEARYLDRLVGPYPEEAERYRARSPKNHLDQLACPVIVLQGLDDEVVPPSQAEQMTEALDAKGLPYAYLAFEGEGHGFRKAETLQAAIEAELSFYAQVFDIELTEPIAMVEVHNRR